MALNSKQKDDTCRQERPESLIINSYSTKFQTTFVVRFFFCFFFYFNKLSFGKMFICKVEKLNVKQRRSRWDGSLSRLIWIHAVCKSLLSSPTAVEELKHTVQFTASKNCVCVCARHLNKIPGVLNYAELSYLSMHRGYLSLDNTTLCALQYFKQ